MSIPDRLWRVMKGHVAIAQEKISEAEARASAYEELADALKDSPRIEAPPTPQGTRVLPNTQTLPTSAPGRFDPMEATYALLELQPGAEMADLERAYEARKADLHPEYYPPGSSERAAVEARRKALDLAYEKLRDALDPVETRFERLEF